MTLVQVMAQDDRDQVVLRTADRTEIADTLRPFGIQLDRWPLRDLPADAGQDAVLTAYRAEVDEVCRAGGYRFVDVVRLVPAPEDPEWPARAAAARGRFLDEHRHTEHEVRFFVEGRGCFYLHLGDKVYALVCEAGDLVSVPAGTTHWFDMGAQPHFCAIRFFEREDGWIGDFTGSPIASTMPTLDELVG
ncbi:1,2-dihydroxy-3-keto-5-methylthiopentene dioxygenase [Nocardia farcinica]|uniref:1,2-dihydroxy-3-keto-5-methylthiopentene dioxygenase n=1 Tax=Nocardia farcinica TaxID=37329 RepID=UPI001893C333|nr:cupin domain-containing protein [Nocardia farcinica]MBF6140471.1 cupin domain-containing protein [Nocardia farcinica]MBF6385733.1 cupin domain-containing protein [Nocardia farcinica]MBF6540635.1 cupin domain-containing protein [Nocardia farcinica]